MSSVFSLLMCFYLCTPARSERYCHLGSDDDDETNDDESSLELRQFSSVAHRFSKVLVIALHIGLHL